MRAVVPLVMDALAGAVGDNAGAGGVGFAPAGTLVRGCS